MSNLSSLFIMRSGDNYFRHIVTAAVPPLILSIWQARARDSLLTLPFPLSECLCAGY